MAIDWKPGPPAARGYYWITWQGAVVPVAIEPALIRLDDPTAPLLIKVLGGMAWHLDAHAKNITHHALLVFPDGPVHAPTIKELIDRSSIGEGLRDIKERGIDAHAADLARKVSRPRRKR